MSSEQPAPPDQNHVSPLQIEQLRLIYAANPPALAASVVCAVVLAAVEWDVSPRLPLLAWLAGMVALTACRYLLVRRFQQAAPERQAQPSWKRLFLAGAASSGLAWGATVPLLLPESSVPHQMFLVFMLGGVTAGAVSTLAARLDAFLCFAVPAIAPVAGYYLIADGPLTTAMAGMIVVFALAMIYVAAQMHATVVRSLLLQLENTGLLERAVAHTAKAERAIEALRRSEEQYRVLYHDTPVMYFTVSPDGTVLSVNQFGAQYLGYAPGELIGGPVSVVIHPEDRVSVRDQLAAALQQPDGLAHWEFRKIRKGGSPLWVKETARVVQADGGAPAVLIVCEDITERKCIERALQESEERFRLLFERATVSMALMDRDKRFVKVNQAFCRLVGYGERELLEQTYALMTHPDDLNRNLALTEQTFSADGTDGYYLEKRYIRKDGALLWVSVTASTITLPDSPLPFLLAFVQDISVRKRAEEALQAARQEREQLARNLHDNIIQSIYAIGLTVEESQSLARTSPKGAARKLDQVVASLNRVIREVRGYLDAPVEEQPTLSANELLTSFEHLDRLMEHANGVRFTMAIASDAVRALTGGQRAQVLYVAQEAMSNCLRHSSAMQARVSLARIAHGVRLEIRDNGVGFTLSRMRNGSGGLKNIRLRARKIGTNLDIASQPMGGTVISMDIQTGG